MGFFDDIGGALSDAFANPINQTIGSFKQVFTNPGKANLGDFISVTIPGGGGTVVSDFKHPQDIATQAAILAAAGGAAYAYSPASAGVYGSSAAATPAFQGSSAVVSYDISAANLATGTPAVGVVSSGTGTSGQLAGISGLGDRLLDGISATTAGIGSAIKGFPTALLALPLVKNLLSNGGGSAPAGAKGSDVSLGLNFANPSGDISNALGNLRGLFGGRSGNSTPSGAVTPQAQLAGPTLIIVIVVIGMAVTYFAPKLFGKKR